ncbi:MAG TPA: FAD:protein FMN transferase [Dokdonella sp.]|nr:FAD:protein FMN transferase [Dokdonella sp.]
MHASIRRCQPLLGTFVEVTVAGAREESELLALGNEAFAQIRRIDALLSFHRAGSELSKVNREAATSTQRISDALREVLAEALWISALSDGLFDVCVAPSLVARGLLPDHGVVTSTGASWRDIELDGNHLRFHRPLMIDLGGIAKGYAVDCAMARMPADVEACVNAGGDLRMNAWRRRSVAIRLPDSASCGFVELAMRNAAVATSLGRAGDHLGLIIDPRDGHASRDNRSFSVFAASAMRADALTKIACLEPDCAALMQRAGAQAIAVDACGTISGPGAQASTREVACA